MTHQLTQSTTTCQWRQFAVLTNNVRVYERVYLDAGLFLPRDATHTRAHMTFKPGWPHCCASSRILLTSLLVLLPVLITASRSCDSAQQGAALSLFYNQSGGPAWFNSSGWSDSDFGSPCMAGLTPLPSHCCWFGVSCCTPETCVDAAESACNCTIGLVIALSLPDNNVSSVHHCHVPLPVQQVFNVFQACMSACMSQVQTLRLCPSPPIHLQIISNHSSASSYIPVGISLSCDLMELDLSQNSVSGIIPPQISEFSKLQTLNVAYNRISGT